MPKVSVIMPVYNGEAYLREAIESILQQTFKDFEFIIINDGSSDGSESIILSYADQRIVYLKNERNRGLIYTLNKAIEHAQGEYIARMDADDISVLNRFEIQIHYLQSHSEVSLLASTVQLIDEEGRKIDNWQKDIQNISFKQIRNYLPVNNCIAHPSVIGPTEIFKQYMYEPDQKYSEDYDLWLRVVADGKCIDKVNQFLVLHRILTTSFTRSKKANIFWGIGKVKMRFFQKQLKRGKLNAFVVIVGIHALIDTFKAFGKEIKKLTRKNEVPVTTS